LVTEYQSYITNKRMSTSLFFQSLFIFLLYVLQEGAAISSLRFWTKSLFLTKICTEQVVGFDEVYESGRYVNTCEKDCDTGMSYIIWSVCVLTLRLVESEYNLYIRSKFVWLSFISITEPVTFWSTTMVNKASGS
jgi:hypothetical protein